MLFILGLIGLGKSGENYNILVVKCIGGVEFNTITMMVFNIIMKLKFGIGIML